MQELGSYQGPQKNMNKSFHFTIRFIKTTQSCFMHAAYNWTSDQWLKWNGNEYEIVNTRMSMEQARQHCQKENSDLVSITTEAESILLWNVVSIISTCQTNAINKAQEDFCFHFVHCVHSDFQT